MIVLHGACWLNLKNDGHYSRTRLRDNPGCRHRIRRSIRAGGILGGANERRASERPHGA